MWILLLVVGTAIWIGYDASANQIPLYASKPYSRRNGAPMWVAWSLCMGIFGIPFYLVHRSKVISLRGAAPPPRPSAVRNDVLADLEKLGELRSKGILTETEFEQKKQQLLVK